jgi:hypothetical protein
MYRWITMVAVSLGLAGCVEVVPAYSPVASHTLKVTPDQEADVVWVQRLDLARETVSLYRCHNSPQGPQCVLAKAP